MTTGPIEFHQDSTWLVPHHPLPMRQVVSVPEDLTRAVQEVADELGLDWHQAARVCLRLGRNALIDPRRVDVADQLD